MEKKRKAEDVAREMESFEVVELDDSALGSISGGCKPGNTNCGCPYTETIEH